MSIKELKNQIETNSVILPLILIKSDESSEIIIDQYINEIARQKDLVITTIESLQQEDLFGQELYILRTKECLEEPKNNTIIICERAKTGIKIPKLEDWQLSQYIKENIVDDKVIDDLVKNCTSKLALLNELEKLLAFPKKERSDLLSKLDLSWLLNYSEFNVSNALLERKRNIDLDRDINPLAIQTILCNNLKLILTVLTNPNVSAEKIGVSEKRLYYMKNHCNHYSVKEIVNILQELTSLELKYKFDGLPFKKLLDYIAVICLNGGC